MEKHKALTKALSKLMPLGGWSLRDGEVTIHEDGAVHGYTVPTQAEIDAAVAQVEHEEPILKELKELDKWVRRDAEPGVLAAQGTAYEDTELVAKVLRKRELRAQL